MFCVNCGKQIESHFKFCPYCAASVSTDKQPNNHSSNFEIVAGKLIKYTGSDVDVIIPSNVIEIGVYSFRDMKNLRSVVIPCSVENIQDSAFDGCSSLSSVEFSYGLKKIGYNAFRDCISLTSIKLPDSLKVLPDYYGYNVFGGCINLSNIGFSKCLSPTVFRGTAFWEEKRRQAIANGRCIKCGGKLSRFGHRCKVCNIEY